MHAVPYQPSGYQPNASIRSRVISFILALAAAVLLIFMLVKMGAISLQKEAEHQTVMLQFQPPPPPQIQARHSKNPTSNKRASHGNLPTPASSATVTAPKPPSLPWNVTPLTSAEFASADIASKPTRSEAAPTQVAGGSGNDTGKDSAAVYGPGDGPDGQQLYNAEWYTHPTDAQLAFYMPHTGAPTGSWAMIACRTIEHYHVEDCRELGETPGTGLARALRQAAWQFLVRPPRVNGKPMIGAWVRIRFDFTDVKTPG